VGNCTRIDTYAAFLHTMSEDSSTPIYFDEINAGFYLWTYNAMQPSERQLTFCRNISPLSSGLKTMPKQETIMKQAASSTASFMLVSISMWVLIQVLFCLPFIHILHTFFRTNCTNHFWINYLIFHHLSK
jgi:hypothetical protein